MARSAKSSFRCPACDALYQVVKINAGQQTIGREMTCQVCGGLFPTREGSVILKYFMLRKAGRRQKWGSGGSGTSLVVRMCRRRAGAVRRRAGSCKPNLTSCRLR
jgi:transcriptional regulator NrdR family protein